MSKKQSRRQLSNINTLRMYQREMVALAENVFQFENLPEYIDVGYINDVLLRFGSIAFFEDEVLGLIALPYIAEGQLDIYGRPLRIRVKSDNGRYNRVLNPGEYVIMYDNTGKYSILNDIYEMAERIALCVRTNDINLIQQRTPRIWKTSKDKELTVKNILREIDTMAESVTTYDSIDIDDLNVVIAPAPYVVDKIDLHLKELWAEFYRLIGVANLQENKKERLIRDEMTATQGGTIASRFSRFETRKRAIESINKKWNLDLSVRYYDGEPSTLEEDDDFSFEIESEVEDKNDI